VLPLTDASVDEIAAELEQLTEEVASELFRVLRRGGAITVAGSSSGALNSERMLAEAGFTDVAAASGGGGSLTARKP
jgi:phosphoserine phosphatase